MTKLFSLAAALALAGCAGVQAAMEYDQTVHRVQMPDDTYRVFEHPAGDRIMTTPSNSRTAASSVVRGATWGVVDTDTPEQLHEAAARKYLDDTGRSHCRIVSGYEILRPQYEFKIDCSAPPSISDKASEPA